MEVKTMNAWNDSAIERIDQCEFKEIDYTVTGVAYEIQNELGRILDERIYRDEMQHRLSGPNENSLVEHESSPCCF